MALEATHMRFALDLKEKFQVRDVEKYIVGAIYPDSRHVTGIDRALTHPVDYIDWHWDTASDFKKGWFAHLLADKMQWLVTKECLPQIFEGEIGPGSEVWVKRTAIKILQDMDDVIRFDIKQYLPYLKFADNPNGEDLKKIKKYNRIFFTTYADPENITIDSYYDTWKKFGIGDELALKVRIKTEQYGKDATVMAAVNKIYQQMLERTKLL